ncbi:odorant receptor 33b-like [Anoplophora glabripennis]|uniref:odorant receptor 33b-like n=1 Tax=Anoplophora glabripennis TaxID=217634 RepID=UPI0008737C54|nr:odorant receptor 33b-like [Anoplophora glabripennis]
MKKFQLKEYLHYNLVVMKYLGLWPKKDFTSDKSYLIYTIIVNGFFNFTTSVGLTGYILTSSNLLEDVIGAGYIILAIMATAKTFFIMKYSKMFKLLVDAEIHRSVNVELNEEQTKILCDYVGFWKKVHLIYRPVIVSISGYSKLVESYFSKYLLIQFTSSCMSTALIMTSMSMNHDDNADIWFLSVSQLGVWADLYIYCWYGNEVTEKSKKIPYAAFESNWVTASKGYKKNLLIFICRTQTPIKLYAVDFFELSLNIFISILRTAYSYYMLLRQLSADE